MKTTVNGIDFKYVPTTLTLDYKYLSLLTQEWTSSSDVTRGGEWITLVVRAQSGVAVYLVETRGGTLLTTSPFDISFTTKELGPFHAFVILTWYYPEFGSFSKTFRVQIGLSRRGNTFRGSFDPSGKGYATREAEARRRLDAWRKAMRRTNSSGAARLSPETKTVNAPIIYEDSLHPANNIHGTQVYPHYSRVYTGLRTPGYWSKRRYELPVNPYSMRTYSIPYYTIIRHSESDTNQGSPPPVTGDNVDVVTRWYGPPAGSSSFVSGNSSRALARLRDKMGADTANLAQDIGEIGETIRMVEQTIRRVHNANHALRVGNFPGAINALWSGNPHAQRSRSKLSLNRRVYRDAKSTFKVLAENWLELQYGWKPLLADVHDAVEKVSRFASQSGDLIVQRVSAGSKFKSQTSTNLTSAFLPNAPNVGKQTIYVEQFDKYGLRWKVADAHKAFLAQTGFLNPINVAWELLPYSFVVDWFLPIGPWLESFTAFKGLEFVDGYFSQLQRERTILAIDGADRSNPGTYLEVRRFEKGLWVRDVVNYGRTKLSSFPLPELPHLKSPWSVGHVLNSLALLAAGFRVGSRYHQ